MDERFKLDNQLCFRLYTASRLITQAYHPLLSEYGLTYPQYLVLLVLWEKHGQAPAARDEHGNPASEKDGGGGHRDAQQGS